MSCSAEVWAAIYDKLSMFLKGNLPQLMDHDLSEDTDSYVSGSLTEVDSEILVNHQATSHKRCRTAAPLDISEVRRSSRSTRFMGFKPPSLADVQKRASHVKQRRIPGVHISEENHDSSAMQVSSAPTVPRQEVPPPMTIASIQQLGVGSCGIPANELTEDKLL